ncbi:MAG TPA: orotate phosphoribosyltransferase [Caldisericia bacterium]|nr:orotate phosphoribosyltransferase [Caldisericia bacterium]HPL89615.1 orotate phosphoribosyltransferase [Caldisericia bacterium]HQG60314.1 orotate phosphoribosyltransferase [Caldisericia bacterium]HQH48251.1 orotate phosphoribosyltransferase [Caldisericia bacterium]HQJ44960.1 orotate phosphoribosyltransferase [Caldisericia bacterium]
MPNEIYDEAASILESANAILTGHFKLTSGLHSDRYIQCAQVFQYPEKVEKLCKLLVQKLPTLNVQTVIGPAVGGIIFAYELSRTLGARNIYAERVDEKMTFRRNFAINPGENVIVVEDVVTTGGSAKEVAELAKANGANVVSICSLVDRSGGKVKFDSPFVPLLRLDVVAYQPEECPLCKAGRPITQPGSRHLKL